MDNEFYIVRHKNPDVPETFGGTSWVEDGVGEGWTKQEAEAHASRCEYAARKIQFEVVRRRTPQPLRGK